MVGERTCELEERSIDINQKSRGKRPRVKGQPESSVGYEAVQHTRNWNPRRGKQERRGDAREETGRKST